jgi:hypothetical protein
LSKLWSGRRNALIIVEPNTTIAWSRKGFRLFTVAKILNHAEHEGTAVCDRHSYDQEKRRALDEWGARLEKIVTGTQNTAKVVRLHRGRRSVTRPLGLR